MSLLVRVVNNFHPSLSSNKTVFDLGGSQDRQANPRISHRLMVCMDIKFHVKGTNFSSNKLQKCCLFNI